MDKQRPVSTKVDVIKEEREREKLCQEKNDNAFFDIIWRRIDFFS